MSCNDDLYVVVPVRGLAEGKSRLASVLTPAQRTALNRTLLAHTLDVLLAWRGELAQCIVVSGCERVLGIAREAGAVTLMEENASGLNAAVTLAKAHAARSGARRVLVLPCDLPSLTQQTLADFVERAAAADVALAPDLSGSGTNALIIGTAHAFEFQFGPNSFALHSRAAAAVGARLFVHRASELAFDLDTPADLERWRLTPDACDIDKHQEAGNEV
ncbi:MAG TPA: 2-phospho-L-lactate guanylyltransferase [Burkholderiales bacterium]|nr:2-phospho-L-lactate guanylyltransferase [Burkholderiales bacterium]